MRSKFKNPICVYFVTVLSVNDCKSFVNDFNQEFTGLKDYDDLYQFPCCKIIIII